MSFLEQKFEWLFKFFDHSQNGAISIEDFVAKGERATEAVKEYFLTQEDGQQLVDDNLELVHENQVNAYKELFNGLVSTVDKSEDSQIDPDEWKAFCHNLASETTSSGSLPGWFQTLLENYFNNVLDADGNGAIDFYELAFMGDAPIELVWFCYDQLTNGATVPLDKENFVDFTKRYMTVEDPEDISRYMFGFIAAQ